MVEIIDIIQILTPVVLTLLGWGVRLIWSEIRHLRDEQREYTTNQTCRMHREHIENQLKELKEQR